MIMSMQRLKESGGSRAEGEGVGQIFADKTAVPLRRWLQEQIEAHTFSQSRTREREREREREGEETLLGREDLSDEGSKDDKRKCEHGALFVCECTYRISGGISQNYERADQEDIAASHAMGCVTG